MNPQQPSYGQEPVPAQGQVPPPQGYGYYPNPAPGQPPQQQPYGYYQPPPGSAPGYPPQLGQYPPGPPGPYGAPGQQPYPPHAQGYGPPAPGQQWQQPPPVQQHAVPPHAGYAAPVPPTPASAGYDIAQKNVAQHVETNSDVEGLRKAMKGFGCDEKALIRILTQTKYSNPWAMAQLVEDYNKRFLRDLAKDLESETRGDLETALLALIRTPLENDVKNLSQALNRAGTDEDALNDVLLCRSNADMRAITAEYKRKKGRDLLEDIKDDVDAALARFYSMILVANRAEDAAPAIPADIEYKVTELQRATEGTIGGANTVAVSQILTSCNDVQIRAVREAFQQKYHAVLDEVIQKEFSGDIEDALTRLLQHSTNRAQSDAARLRSPLRKTIRKDKLFINRVMTLYWDRPRLEAAKKAYKKAYGTPLYKDIKDALSGDYEDLMVALVGKE